MPHQQPNIENLKLERMPEELAATLQIETETASPQSAVRLETIDAENLYSVTTVNQNGTLSAYSYSQPIKYIEKETNAIKFIDNTLKETSIQEGFIAESAFTNTANDIQVIIPKKIKNGIRIEKGGFMIKMAPAVNENTEGVKKGFTFLGQAQSVVEFPHVFGQGTHLQYAAVNTGIKENIVIEEYNGINEFTFEIEAKGMTPNINQDSSITFMNTQTGEAVYTMPKPWAMDSYTGEEDGNTHLEYNVTYQIEKNGHGNGKYILKLAVNKEFLENPATVYPIIIDPYTTYTTTGTSNMPYTAVYQSGWNRCLQDYVAVGRHSTAGEAISYIKLLNVNNFKYINPQRINTVTANMKQTYGGGSSYIVNCYDSTTSVVVQNASYNEINSHTGVFLDSTLCQGNATYGWWITNVFKAWLQYEINGQGWPEYQFILKPESSNKPIKEFLCSGNNLWLKIDYTADDDINGSYYIRNVNSGKYLDVKLPARAGSNVQQWEFTGSINQMFSIYAQANGQYKLYPQIGNQYSCCLTATGSNIDVSSNVQSGKAMFHIVSNNDGTYRIMNSYSGYARALDVEGISSDNGANVHLYDYVNGNNQKWVLEKITNLAIMDSVPQIGQERHTWCWVASPAMLAKYYRPDIDKSQSEIVMAINGRLTDDEGKSEYGDLNDSFQAARFATDYTVSFTKQSSSLTQAQLIDCLNYGNPVCITRKISNTLSHNTVIYGYVNYKGLRFLVRDPWPDNNRWPSNGQSYTRTYEELVNGNSTGVDNSRWIESLFHQ